MRISKDKPSMRFSELFADSTSRTEVVVTFLALLELIRMKHLRVLQSAAFSEIEISLAPPRIDPPLQPTAENGAATPAPAPESVAEVDKTEPAPAEAAEAPSEPSSTESV
jgi:hypothetical protein